MEFSTHDMQVFAEWALGLNRSVGAVRYLYENGYITPNQNYTHVPTNRGLLIAKEIIKIVSYAIWILR